MKMIRNAASLLVLAALLASCRTVGWGRHAEGFAEVSPNVAHEMMLDSQQVIVLDMRTSEQYRGPEGHIAGSFSAPLDTIERQLPELLPYQSQTVLVYGETSTDGALGAKLLAASGFRNVVHISGGLHDWIEHGYRTVNSR
jgi:rhodanese-related sulfurtransferase